MNIIPISAPQTLAPLKSILPTDPKKTETPFQAMFDDAVSNLESLNSVKSQDGVNLSLGNLDDIGQMQVNGEKAEVALQLLIQMRNKVLESYQEIMRLNV